MAQTSDRARDGLGSVTRGTLILLLGTLGFVGANFVARVILVRNLSPQDFGEYYIALALSGLVTVLGQLGLPAAVARSIPFAASDTDRRTVIRTGFLIAIPLALGAGLVLELLSIPISQRYHSPVLGLTLQYFAVAVSCGIVASQIAAVFQGFEDVRPNTIFIQLLNPLLFIVFLTLFLTQGPGRYPLGYTGALVAYVLANVASLVGILVYLRMRLRRSLPAGPGNPAAARRLVLFALPLLVVGLFSYLAGSLDTLILGFFHNSEAGPYGAALSLARLLLIGLGALAYILLPVIARYVRYEDRSSAGLIYGTATRWMVLASLPFALVFFVFPGPALTVVYNAQYAANALPLRILVIGATISGVIGPASAAQVSFGQTRYLLINNLAAAVTDGVLSLLLVPPYGIVGASIAWTIATALIPILSMSELVASEHIRPFPAPYFVGLVLTILPLGLLFSLLPFVPGFPALALFILATAVVFVLVQLVVVGISDGDRLLLEAVEKLLGGRRLPGVRRLARWFGRSRRSP